jgi:AraC-like DNA-binding protein
MNKPLKKKFLYLWEERSLFIGEIDQALEFCQVASYLVIALEGKLIVTDKAYNNTFECTSLLVPAGRKVTLDSQGGLIANLSLDVFGRDFEKLLPFFKFVSHNIEHQIIYENRFHKIFRECLIKEHSIEWVKCSVDSLIKSYFSEPKEIDERVIRLVNSINANVESNISIENLSKEVSLSPPQVQKIFKSQTGIPIRKYRNWRRISKTAAMYSKGVSITEASIFSGFSDSSHFINSFHKVFGIRPSCFLNSDANIKIIT